MDEFLNKFGVAANDGDLKSSIRQGCFTACVHGIHFLVPFGSIELFLKMALSCQNDITILASENSDFFLV